jgi:formylglycine-generating enzyme required for sulfatase activity
MKRFIPFLPAMLMLAVLASQVYSAAPSSQPTSGSASQIAKELTLDLGNNVRMKLVLIPAGKFLMGSPETEKDRDKNEVQHEVTISKPFYMGVTHVTVDQFTAFVTDSGYKTDAQKSGWSWRIEIKDGKLDFKQIEGISWLNPSFDQKGDHPVVHVDWNDSKAFCDWLSKKSGKAVALPTEAQWEYACRAGAKTAYSFGESASQMTEYAWFSGNSTMIRRFGLDVGQFNEPVGQKKPNAWGLYDMHGNVSEWCSAWYWSGSGYAATDTIDPTGPASGRLGDQRRILRGGSSRSDPAGCRSAYRDSLIPVFCNNYVGFRVAVEFK